MSKKINVNFDPDKPQILTDGKGKIAVVSRELFKVLNPEQGVVRVRRLHNRPDSHNGGYVSSTILIISSIILLTIIIFTGIGNILGK